MSNPSSHPISELSPDSRRALYYRLHGLRALLGRPWVARALRLAGWLVLAGWLLFVALMLALRFVILPSVADYRGEIEGLASQAVGQPVRIAQIEAHWRGLNPELVLDGVSLLDADGVPALTLGRIDTVLSWHSLWQFQPVLALLSFERPVLHVRRDVDGRIRVAG
ncbi:MAG: TIGR02099 family protein, partial [Dechloromonas sp.]|nr:TIGR02099 family protein [Dechloromonas sp.]